MASLRPARHSAGTSSWRKAVPGTQSGAGPPGKRVQRLGLRGPLAARDGLAGKGLMIHRQIAA